MQNRVHNKETPQQKLKRGETVKKRRQCAKLRSWWNFEAVKRAKKSVILSSQRLSRKGAMEQSLDANV